MSGTNQEGTASSQDRARQPKRAGGNSPEYGIESHGQKRATRIGICGEGGAGTDTGKNSTWGAQRDCGGNTANAPIEKHDQPKMKGKHFVGGVEKNAVGDIPVNIQVDTRGEDTSGNCSTGGVEKTGQKKATHLDLGKHRLGANE